jgi:hypothetical protein
MRLHATGLVTGCAAEPRTSEKPSGSARKLQLAGLLCAANPGCPHVYHEMGTQQNGMLCAHLSMFRRSACGPICHVQPVPQVVPERQ